MKKIPGSGISSSVMAHIQHDKKQLLARIRRIGGQVSALERAIEGDSDCSEVLVQIAAAKGAMHALMMKVLTGHLSEHVVAEKSEAGRAKEAQVIMELLARYAR